jgi:glycerol-3-phosphate acyltransferase PlsY
VLNGLTAFASLLVCYLLGAIPFALLIARAHGIADLRRVGSGNVGATNVWRVAGRRAALWVFAADIGKGVAAVLIGRSIAQDVLPASAVIVLCGAAAVIGHMFPVYLGFRGGKGVNTGLGVVATLLPLETLIALVAFVAVMAATRFVSLGSMLAAAVLTATVLIERFVLQVHVDTVNVILVCALAVLVIAAHHANIRRLLAGTEPRFEFSSRKKAGPTDG